MPPSISNGPLTSLSRCRCAKFSIPLRPFSTSHARLSIGPEHPKFINVPIPPQGQNRPPVIIKGTLPPPRNLFRKRDGDKTSPAYLAAVTKEPQERPDTKDDFLAWKRRLAATRRESLREALVALAKRKEWKDRKVASRSLNRTKIREKALAAPQREDERLTNPTIKASNSTFQTGPAIDPNRRERVAKMAERVKAIQRMKAQARRDALHTLYMNARTFITTEEQLNAKVEEIFTEHPHAANNTNQNIWVVKGHPPTVQKLLAEVNGVQKSAVEYHAGPAAITGQRMKKIAEELTGGKMD